ncbi:MAG: sodium-independent anion transporter [Sulfuricurvum sp. GWF2_44_89]|uniref:Sodium-independent anion transporter n=1 Tax=Sulfuricurvum kujiense TaxID=148813 RepID=A0A2D3WJM4_9BACT|nr:MULTISPECIES: SulP family inorganic anion transporter [Sulfuricurvum]OHD78849.1 MAG: sodium-independent anion transporter [Sulfuricurvum sp. GWF2_44_89]OHD92879.1 MAG: sodium-independent anion transporter [Sulfuricurvum sp. RIFOXYD12_FULL_44_77]OHD96617.1 MAG: sodium-independent anion transporter [Sulfuricurvum sp. RIFOXYD2_FULL_44_160]DAB38937.1 MAG TPA: sodium-independent anion transporter [Sulfuricurvum kujiense]
MLLLSPKQEWFGNIRGDILAGIVVALALIPEAIAFSIIAGVDPKVGLYASFCIATVIAFVGGRAGMISAATGAMALLMVTLVKEHGLQYLMAATLLTGVLQILAGYLKLGVLMSFVSRTVVIGFVNALAILIFTAQLPELTNVTWHVYALTAAGLGIIYLFPYIPKLGRLIPSPLVTIVVLTAVTVVMGIDVRTVGDMGALPDTLPIFLWPDVPMNFETLSIIFPYSAALAAVGLLESFMTATIVDDMTDTDSDKNREAKGQGIANIASGCMGGMAGCAMIGQSVINIKSGGRGRLSTLIAGVLLLIMVVFMSDLIKIIPMAALVAVMIMVSIGTFNWDSIKGLKTLPLSTNVVMLSTVFVVVGTHNLALGVFTGVLLASLFFANKISHFMYWDKSFEETSSTRVYKFIGQIFFNSADRFADAFDYKEDVKNVIIDVTRAHFWDITAVYALDKAVIKLRNMGKEVEVIGQNEATRTIIDRFGVHDKPSEIDKVMGGH